MTPTLLTVGASRTSVCGIRDYNRTLCAALESVGAAVRTVWWERDCGDAPLRCVRSARRWTDDIRAEVESFDPDWLVWHYNPVTYGFHAVPFLLLIVVPALRRNRRAVVVVVHEYAHDFGSRGWRGNVLALAQRVSLRFVVGSSRILVVTTEARRQWFLTRAWLPSRPVHFAPVPSNFPDAAAVPSCDNPDFVVGVLGYGAEGFDPTITVQALATLRSRGMSIRLLLIGSPGGKGERWLASAQAAGIADFVSATGVLDPEAAAAAIASTSILVFPYDRGATPRKTMLAASLASGRPVVALAGPETWRAFLDEDAIAVAMESELSDVIEELVLEPERRVALGSRGRAFYERHMAPRVLAGDLLEFLEGWGS